LLVVSHDRDFLDRVATAVLVSEGKGRWLEYAGGYSDMVRQRGTGVEARTSTSRPLNTGKGKTPTAASQPVPETKRKLSFKEKHALETIPARMEALERANEIRSRRAQLKRDLRGGKTTIDRLLEAPPEYLETAKVFDLLLATPKYGRVKANKVLQQVRISPSKTVGGLSERQRGELVLLLRSRLN